MLGILYRDDVARKVVKEGQTSKILVAGNSRTLQKEQTKNRENSTKVALKDNHRENPFRCMFLNRNKKDWEEEETTKLLLPNVYRRRSERLPREQG